MMYCCHQKSRKIMEKKPYLTMSTIPRLALLNLWFVCPAPGPWIHDTMCSSTSVLSFWDGINNLTQVLIRTNTMLYNDPSLVLAYYLLANSSIILPAQLRHWANIWMRIITQYYWTKRFNISKYIKSYDRPTRYFTPINEIINTIIASTGIYKLRNW